MSLVVPLGVILAEDDLLVREGLRSLLAAREEISVLAACADGVELHEALGALDPAVVITDVRMPPTKTDEGIRLAQGLRHTHPGLGVVVLSQHLEPAYAAALLDGGAAGRGFLLKERISDVEMLVGAVRTVATGGSILDPELVDALVGAGERSGAVSPLSDLTGRERTVLAEMARGRSNAAIAQQLTLSNRAVEKHVGAIFLKLGLRWEQEVSRRVMAVLMFLTESERR